MDKKTNQETESLHGVSAIQMGSMRVEYLKPDYALAYATLTAHVGSAYAYCNVKEYEFAMTSLQSAVNLIEIFHKKSGMLAVETNSSLDK